MNITTPKRKRTLSKAAQVAKLAKQYCKSLGINARCTSENYSMGDSVNVYLKDINPEISVEIETHLKQYQYGHFNGMEDIYEYSNRRDDLPQTKHLFVNSEYSAELKEKAYQFLLQKYANTNLKNAPANFEEAKDFDFYDDTNTSYTPHDNRVDQIINRQLLGTSSIDETQKEFWASLNPPKNTPQKGASYSSKTDTGAIISEHTHTKKGFKMWIVEINERVERDVYLRLLDQARLDDGWYSRKWGKTPAGFAFKCQDAATKFKNSITTSEPTTQETKPVIKQPKPAATAKPEKLKTLAENMQKQIDDKFADRLTNTQKRLAQAQSARNEGERLLRTQALLNEIANHIESDTLPLILADISTKKKAYKLMASKSETVMNGFHPYYMETGEPASEDPQALAAWDLIDEKTSNNQEREKRNALERLQNKAQFAKIPGYYPTPSDLIDRMLNMINLKEGDTVLEPSAGSGAIADKVKAITSVKCCEINPTLREILKLKEHTLENDFLDLPETEKFDVVIMNPPFENQQDTSHVKKAYIHLKSGGRLVSIMSPSFTFLKNNRCESFRHWLNEKGGTWEELPTGSFKESGTYVNSVIVTIHKD